MRPRARHRLHPARALAAIRERLARVLHDRDARPDPGLDPARYFALSRAAWEAVAGPEILRRIRLPRRVAPEAIEQAFLEANPDLSAEAVTVICKGRMFREARICLTKELDPRPCAGPAARECPLDAPLFAPMR